MSDQESHPTPERDGRPKGPPGGAAREYRQIVLEKSGQRYVFRYAPGEEPRVMEDLAGMARDPACALGWFDAAVASHQVGVGLKNQIARPRKASI
jgi:hypothetical protein